MLANLLKKTAKKKKKPKNFWREMQGNNCTIPLFTA